MKLCIACAEKIKADAKLCRHCGTRQDDERFVSESPASVVEDSGAAVSAVVGEEDEPLTPLIVISSVILLPTALLLVLDPTLSDGGPAEVLGNASFGIAGWSVFALVLLPALLAFPQLRSSPRWRTILRRFGYIFATWVGVALLLFGISVSAGFGGASAQPHLAPGSEPPPAAQSEPVLPTPVADNPATLEACRQYQTWVNSRPDADGDLIGYLTDEQTKLVSLFRDVPDTTIRQAVNDYIVQIRVMKVVVSSNPSDQVLELAASDSYAAFVNVWDLCNDEY
jgi:hypothetical protein